MKWTTVLLCLVFSFSATAERVYKWHIEEVDSVGPGSRTVELKVDKSGRIHTAYAGCDRGQDCSRTALWYAHKMPGGEWHRELIDNDSEDIGRHASLELTPDGRTHIMYADKTHQRLRWAYRDKGQTKWKIKVLDKKWGGSWVNSASYGNTVYVTQTQFKKRPMNGNWLQLGTYKNGSWSFESIEKGGWTTHVTTDLKGNPIISSHDGPYSRGYTHLTFKKNGVWQYLPIDSKATKSEVKVDSLGFIHVTWIRVDASTEKDDVHYATNRPDGVWRKEKIDPRIRAGKADVLFPTLAIDHDDNVHISFWDLAKAQLTYARRKAGTRTWDYQILENLGDPYYSRLIVSPQGKLHIAIENMSRLFYGYCENCTDKN